MAATPATTGVAMLVPAMGPISQLASSPGFPCIDLVRRAIHNVIWHAKGTTPRVKMLGNFERTHKPQSRLAGRTRPRSPTTTVRQKIRGHK